jgi:hypothetical protein
LYESSTDGFRERDLLKAAANRKKTVQNADDSSRPEDHRDDLISFFLAGVGDARNMFRTIIGILEVEKTTTKRYHFTINDINKYALTRDLLVFMLIEELLDVQKGTDEHMEVLSTVYFIYVGVIIPQYALDKMQSTIGKALDALTFGHQPSRFIYLYERHYPEYISVLRSWQGEALTVLTTREVFKLAKQQVGGLATMMGEQLELSTKCKAERNLYLTSLVLQPPKRMLQKYDPVMLKELEDCANRPQTNTPRLKCRDYLLENWRVNTTMVDVEWYAGLEIKSQIDFGHDPFEAAMKLTDPYMKDQPPPIPMCLYDYVGTFFSSVADSIKKLDGRLQVEVLLGDCVDVAEQLRFDLFNHEDAADEKLDSVKSLEDRPKHFPRTFDRVHLSNVP